MKTFEYFLQDEFMDLREIGGVPIMKDNAEDMFDSWMQGLDVDEWLELGDKYGDTRDTPDCRDLKGSADYPPVNDNEIE